MAEHDRLGHDVLADDVGTGLDHHDRVTGTRDDQVDSESLSWVTVGLSTNSPLIRPIRTGATGPLNGISLMVSAADAAIVPMMSGSFSWSVERTVMTSWTSSL